MATSSVTDSNSMEFIKTVESSSKEGILLRAKDLVWKLGHLQIPQERMDSLIIGQFHLAMSSHDFNWVRAIRREATIIYSDSWIDQHLPAPGGKKKSSSQKRSPSFNSTSTDSTGTRGMCKDVCLSMGQELTVIQEVVYGDASAETTLQEDPQAMDCVPSSDVVPVSQETVAPPHSSLSAEASCPSFSSSAVQTDGSTLVTTESVVVIDTLVDKPSSAVSRKRKPDGEMPSSSRKVRRSQTRVQRCPFPECSQRSSRMKRHIYRHHLPKCFSEEKCSENDHVMCVHAINSLSIAILDKVDYDGLLQIVNSPGAIPDSSNIHPVLVEKMKGFSHHNQWPVPREFSLHPINSKALLLHYRSLSYLLLLLSEEQRQGLTSDVADDSSEDEENEGIEGCLTITCNTSSKSSSRTVESNTEAVSNSQVVGTSPVTAKTRKPKKNIVSTSSVAPSSSLAPSSSSSAPSSSSSAPSSSSSAPSSSSSAPSSSSLAPSPSSYQVVASQGKRKIERVEQPPVAVSTSYATAVKTDLPSAFDSHFHFDRSCFRIWGTAEGKTPEDLVRFGQAECRPAHPVRLIGGVAVFSEPNNYDLIPNRSQKWCLAVGVHPKHVEELTDSRYSQFQFLLKRPSVRALGEVGLDRTVPVSAWRRQEAILDKVLGCAVPNQCLVLHLRGSRDDKYGTDVHARCLRILDRTVARRQKIHLHSFTGDAGLVSEWREMYPNTYFGISGLVRSFDTCQIEALRSIPMDRLLLETDSPYLSVNHSINSPACIGDIAHLVAKKMGKPLEEILSRSVENGVLLYQ